MKNSLKIIVLVLAIVGCLCTALAQDGMSFSALHDVKLGLGMDKEHKNDKPTLDLILNMNWEGKQQEYYYFSIQTQYETAQLYDGFFKRYSVHGVWNFNKLIIPKLEVAAGVGIGAIDRKNSDTHASYSFTVDISYPIFKDFYAISKNEWVRRTELATPKTCYNFSLGFKYKGIKL